MNDDEMTLKEQKTLSVKELDEMLSEILQSLKISLDTAQSVINPHPIGNEVVSEAPHNGPSLSTITDKIYEIQRIASNINKTVVEIRGN